LYLPRDRPDAFEAASEQLPRWLPQLQQRPRREGQLLPLPPPPTTKRPPTDWPWQLRCWRRCELRQLQLLPPQLLIAKTRLEAAVGNLTRAAAVAVAVEAVNLDAVAAEAVVVAADVAVVVAGGGAVVLDVVADEPGECFAAVGFADWACCAAVAVVAVAVEAVVVAGDA